MLNTKLEEKIETSVSAEEAMVCCRKAVAETGWRVLNQSQNHIQCKEVAVSGMSFNWPAEVEINISSTGPSSSIIFLNGTIFGFGPIQKGHLQGQVGNLRNRIEITMHDVVVRPAANKARATESLGDELIKLSALHKQGILTDEEFRKAKEKLIEDQKS